MKECTSCGRCLADDEPFCPDDGGQLAAAFPGSRILDGRYRLLHRIGSGGTATVYRTRHLGLGRIVALKVLHSAKQSNDRMLARFQREAEVLSRLRHSNVVEVTDFGVDRKRRIPYLVMELLEGWSLAQRLRSDGPLEVRAGLAVFEQIAAGLDHAHRHGVVHGDLKPSNVFLLRGNHGSPASKLVDFGLARILADPEETPAIDPVETSQRKRLCKRPRTRALGTPGFRAPELLRGEDPSPASDVYAFGVLIFASLVGRRPAEGDELASDSERRLRLPQLLRDRQLDPHLDRAILAPLAVDPRMRPASAADTVADFRESLRRIERRQWRAREWPRRLAMAAGLGLFGSLLAVALASPLQRVENKSIDARFYFAPSRPPSPRLGLVVFDEASLDADPAPLASRADEVGTRLQELLAAGATGVGLDILLPAQWSTSGPFLDMLLEHADAVVLASYTSPEGRVIGPEVLGGLAAVALGPEQAEEMFGFVNLVEDSDAVVRRFHRFRRDVTGHLRPSFASRVATTLRTASTAELSEGAETTDTSEAAEISEQVSSGDSLWLDYTIDWTGYPVISWRQLPQVLAGRPEQISGRFFVVGGSYTASGDPRFRVPRLRGRPAEVPGTMLQTLAVQTLLDGAPVRSFAWGWTTVAAAVANGLVVASLLLSGELLRALWVAPLVGLVWLVASLSLFAWSQQLVPTVPPLVSLVIMVGFALFLRRRLPGQPR